MQRRDGLAHLGFDEVFTDVELYLAYSEAGFGRGYLDSPTLIREGPREHRRGNQRVGFGCGRGASGGVCDRPHRPQPTSSTWYGACLSPSSMPPRRHTATRFGRWPLLALVSTWGLRLSWHMYRKTAGQGRIPVPLQPSHCARLRITGAS